MKIMLLLFLCLLGMALVPVLAAEHPEAEITNGLIHVKLYLPDAQKGFYRGTRFDWSGVISRLEWNGHTYFGQWFAKFDPAVRDVEFDAAVKGYKAGPISASMGPVEEFTGADRSALGYAEAPAGGTFIKIGVGVLRKPKEAKYDNYERYEIVDPGKWTVHTTRTSVEFIQEIDSGAYAYTYHKTVRLVPGKPGMVIEHSLKNTGKNPIETNVYNHNFFVIDKQPSGPDFTIRFPFELKAERPMEGSAKVEGKQIQYTKVLENGDTASTALEGFGNSASDFDFRVENRKTGAGVRVTGDQPLARLYFWTIPSTLSPEAFNQMNIAPGRESKWNISYEFYELPGSGSR